MINESEDYSSDGSSYYQMKSAADTTTESYTQGGESDVPRTKGAMSPSVMSQSDYSEYSDVRSEVLRVKQPLVELPDAVVRKTVVETDQHNEKQSSDDDLTEVKSESESDKKLPLSDMQSPPPPPQLDDQSCSSVSQHDEMQPSSEPTEIKSESENDKKQPLSDLPSSSPPPPQLDDQTCSSVSQHDERQPSSEPTEIKSETDKQQSVLSPISESKSNLLEERDELIVSSQQDDQSPERDRIPSLPTQISPTSNKSLPVEEQPASSPVEDNEVGSNSDHNDRSTHCVSQETPSSNKSEVDFGQQEDCFSQVKDTKQSSDLILPLNNPDDVDNIIGSEPKEEENKTNLSDNCGEGEIFLMQKKKKKHSCGGNRRASDGSRKKSVVRKNSKKSIRKSNGEVLEQTNSAMAESASQQPDEPIMKRRKSSTRSDKKSRRKSKREKQKSIDTEQPLQSTTAMTESEINQTINEDDDVSIIVEESPINHVDDSKSDCSISEKTKSPSGQKNSDPKRNYSPTERLYLSDTKKVPRPPGSGAPSSARRPREKSDGNQTELDYLYYKKDPRPSGDVFFRLYPELLTASCDEITKHIGTPSLGPVGSKSGTWAPPTKTPEIESDYPPHCVSKIKKLPLPAFSPSSTAVRKKPPLRIKYINQDEVDAQRSGVVCIPLSDTLVAAHVSAPSKLGQQQAEVSLVRNPFAKKRGGRLQSRSAKVRLPPMGSNKKKRRPLLAVGEDVLRRKILKLQASNSALQKKVVLLERNRQTAHSEQQTENTTAVISAVLCVCCLVSPVCRDSSRNSFSSSSSSHRSPAVRNQSNVSADDSENRSYNSSECCV